MKTSWYGSLKYLTSTPKLWANQLKKRVSQSTLVLYQVFFQYCYCPSSLLTKINKQNQFAWFSSPTNHKGVSFKMKFFCHLNPKNQTQLYLTCCAFFKKLLLIISTFNEFLWCKIDRKNINVHVQQTQSINCVSFLVSCAWIRFWKCNLNVIIVFSMKET